MWRLRGEPSSALVLNSPQRTCVKCPHTSIRRGDRK